MAYFKLVSCCNKLTAIPKAPSGFDRRDVNKSGNKKGKPTGQVVDLLVVLHYEWLKMPAKVKK